MEVNMYASVVAQVPPDAGNNAPQRCAPVVTV